MHPPVLPLQLHLPNYQYATFRATDPIEGIIDGTLPQRTMLTEFFEMNRLNPVVKTLHLLYKKFPEHFVWDRVTKTWCQWKKGTLISRVVTDRPVEKERYFLRLLLQFRRGPTSFDDLKTVNGKRCETFQAPCVALGLLDSDTDIIDCLNEASQYHLPPAFSQLFATILVFCTPAEPQQLWTLFFEYCIYVTSSSAEMNISPELRAIAVINKYLAPLGSQIQDFGIHVHDDATHKNPQESYNYDFSVGAMLASQSNSVDSLNIQQLQIYNEITEKLERRVPFICFIDGPAGTGKTFLYNTILGYALNSRILAIPAATSGVAASLLPNGQTVHSKFKLPRDVSEGKKCNISKQSSLAAHLTKATLIIWDEILMAWRELIEAVDTTLKDITVSNEPFGGIVVVFGGDFRQITPLIPNATKDMYIEESCVCSSLFVNAHKFHLTINMRARHGPLFATFLESIGNNTSSNNSNGAVKLPLNTLLSSEENTLPSLIHRIFSPNVLFLASPLSLATRSILTTTNETVDQINRMVINGMPGEQILSPGRDVTSQQAQYEDYLAIITPNGMPPHTLTLKKGAPLMLLRNLDPTNGLSNGTQLICKQVTQNVIQAEIIIGPSAGRICFIPKIPLQPQNLHESSVDFN